MFMNATREDTVKKVASTNGMVRWDLLKRGIQALSKSPEAYLAIRAQFARTLSTFNVASYIIGACAHLAPPASIVAHLSLWPHLARANGQVSATGTWRTSFWTTRRMLTILIISTSNYSN